MLTVIGDLVEDVVVWTTGPTQRGTDNPATVTRARGGSAANVAAHAAARVPTRFVGRVGDDPAGSWLATVLRDAGVDVRVQRGGRSGTVVVIVDPFDGERTMYPDRGAATELVPVADDWLAGTTLLHVPAYGLAEEPAATSILAAIEVVRGWGARLSIDVSAVTVVEQIGRGPFVELLGRLQPEILLANADEAEALGVPLAPPAAGSVVVVKDGPRPARLHLDDGSCHAVDAEPVADVRDTTGAGDAFAAGFLAAWMVGDGPLAACRAGHATAASVLASAGAA